MLNSKINRPLKVLLSCLLLFVMKIHSEAGYANIEEVQRALQARSFGSCTFEPRIGDTSAPAYPHDGYYQQADHEDINKIVAIVQNLVNNFNSMDVTVYISTNLQGSFSGITKFQRTNSGNVESYVPTLGAVTSGNYHSKVGEVREWLQRFKAVEAGGAYFNNAKSRSGSASHVRPGIQDCGWVQGYVVADFLAAPWVDSAQTFPYETEEAAKINQQNNDWAVSLNAKTSRINFNAENQTNGLFECFIKVKSPEGGTPNFNPPVENDGFFHSFGSFGGGAIWSEKIEAGAGLAPGECYVAHSSGWKMDSTLVVRYPDFEEFPCNPDNACTTCEPGGGGWGGGAAAGAAGAGYSGGVATSFSMGADSHGHSAGQLKMSSLNMSVDLATPKYLFISNPGPNTEIIHNASNYQIRQIKTAQLLVDVVVINNLKYELRYYTAANAGSKSGGFYQPTGSPYVTYVVENPDGTTLNYNRLKITEVRGAKFYVTEFNYVKKTKTWEKTSGNGLRRETFKSVYSGNYRTDTHTVKDAGGKVTYKETLKYYAYTWGTELIEKTIDPDGAALKTTWSHYWAGSSSIGTYSKVEQVVYPNGYWEKFQYDSIGRVTNKICQYLDGSLNSAENLSRVTKTTYSSGDPAVTEVQTLLGQEVLRRYTIQRPGEVWDVQCQTPGAAWNAANNLVTISKYYLGGSFPYHLKSIKYPDGTMSLYQYASTATEKTTTVFQGEANALGTALVNGTKTVRVEDIAGNVISETVYNVASGVVGTTLSEQIRTTADDFGRPTRMDFLDDTYETVNYGCCGVESIRDSQGIVTTFTYDDLKRMKSTTRAGVTTIHTYDPQGKVLTTRRKGSDLSVIVHQTNSYDLAGRLVSSKDALNYETTHSYSTNPSGQSLITTTFADNSTRIETYHKDGSLLSLTGTAVHPMKYEYGVHDKGDFVKEIKLGSNNEETEWQKNYSDLVTRLIKTEYPDGAYSTNLFNNSGQLTNSIDPDGVSLIFTNNVKGEQEYQVADMDRDGVIDWTGTDRIIRFVNEVATAYSTTVKRSSTIVWATDNINSGTTVAMEEASADGTKSWVTQNGLTTFTQTAYDQQGGRTEAITFPDGSVATNSFTNGRLTASIKASTDGVVSSVTYSYDAHGRLKTSTDARNGATTYTYTNRDEIESVTTPSAGTGIPPQTTAYIYDKLGRQSSVLFPDGGSVFFEYRATGELKKTYGARTYPVEYTYDSQGRMKTMKTWQDFEGNAGAATTTWTYHSQRGWLTSKTYHNNTQGPAYTYKASGRILTREWARGLTTTYSYNNAGEVSGMNHSDSTPDVTFSHNRLGLLSSSEDGSGTHNFGYNAYGKLLTSSVGSISVTNGYDSLLRRNSLKLGVSGVQIFEHTYGYDGASRLFNATADGTNSVTYSYLANSSLVGTLTFKRSSTTVMTTTKQYDYLTRLTSIASVAGGNTVSSYSYQYNSANQRTQSSLSDNSYWKYGYDNLGQVISGKKYFSDDTPVAGFQQEHSYDDIGNRVTSKARGNFEGSGLLTSTYTPNLLNQYEQRTVAGATTITGQAELSTKVTVNQQSVDQKGKVFYKKQAASNTANPVFQNQTVVGVTNNVGAGQLDVVTEITGKTFVPKTPEVFSYDADGNLTEDGRWTYVWDAENRLIEMTTRSAAVTAGAPNLKLEFGYDAFWRRTTKKVYQWNSGSGTWNLQTHTKFVYDGWNLISELNGTNNSAIRTYLWGLDLSGTIQGAGGVGGLLSILDGQSSIAYWPSYDGSGNISSLVRVSDASLAARYEYGAFGEVLRAIGSYAQANPFQFSTKYQDQESGLNYYGYRYYNASAGKWLSRDPIQERGGLNLSNILNNDPVNRMDILGLDQKCSVLLAVGHNSDVAAEIKATYNSKEDSCYYAGGLACGYPGSPGDYNQNLAKLKYQVIPNFPSLPLEIYYHQSGNEDGTTDAPNQGTIRGAQLGPEAYAIPKIPSYESNWASQSGKSWSGKGWGDLLNHQKFQLLLLESIRRAMLAAGKLCHGECPCPEVTIRLIVIGSENPWITFDQLLKAAGGTKALEDLNIPNVGPGRIVKNEITWIYTCPKSK